MRQEAFSLHRPHIAKRTTASLLIVISMAAVAAITTMGTALASVPGSSIARTKHAGGNTLVLQIGPAMKMSTNGMGGEKMMGGKKARCSMPGGMQMIAGHSAMRTAKCNHHVELHVYRNGMVVHGARVRIRMYCLKMHMNVWVPIMTMMMPNHPRDFHYGNNVHAPKGFYNVFVAVNGVHTKFNNVYIRP